MYLKNVISFIPLYYWSKAVKDCFPISVWDYSLSILLGLSCLDRGEVDVCT